LRASVTVSSDIADGFLAQRRAIEQRRIVEPRCLTVAAHPARPGRPSGNPIHFLQIMALGAIGPEDSQTRAALRHMGDWNFVCRKKTDYMTKVILRTDYRDW
jgi:hypothetical protein